MHPSMTACATGGGKTPVGDRWPAGLNAVNLPAMALTGERQAGKVTAASTTRNLFWGTGPGDHSLAVTEGHWPTDMDGRVFIVGPDKRQPGGHLTDRGVRVAGGAPPPTGGPPHGCQPLYSPPRC